MATETTHLPIIALKFSSLAHGLARLLNVTLEEQGYESEGYVQATITGRQEDLDEFKRLMEPLTKRLNDFKE